MNTQKTLNPQPSTLNFRRWVISLAAICVLVTLYAIRDWYPMNILCVLTVYATSFTALWLCARVVCRPGVPTRRSPSIPVHRVHPRPSPQTGRTIYINLLTRL